jgi:hypothetical protein
MELLKDQHMGAVRAGRAVGFGDLGRMQWRKDRAKNRRPVPHMP